MCLEGYGRGSNSPLKTIADAREAGTGNLPFRGALPESQRIKERGSVPCEGGVGGSMH